MSIASRTGALVMYVLLLVLGGRVEVPVGPVPFILTDFVVFLGAWLLTPKSFLTGTLIFLLLGALGLPVFAGGVGSLSHFAGPTSGYLLGYLIGGAFVAFGKQVVKRIAGRLLVALFGYYVLFVCGIIGLLLTQQMTFQKALEVGLLPFLLSLHLKGTVAWGMGELIGYGRALCR